MADINFGSGPNTSTGDTVNAAFVKMQDRMALAEAQVGIPTASISAPVTLPEGNSGSTTFAWTVTLNRKGFTGAVNFTWSVLGAGTNPADASDFVGGVLPSGSGVFASGETTKVINVLVNGDTTVEATETFAISVTCSLTAGVVGSVGTITNDDSSNALLTAPVISGNATNGSILTVTPSTWTGSPTITRQWARDGQAISGATGTTYTYNSTTDDGTYLQCIETANGSVVTASNALLASSATMTYSTSFSGPDGTNFNGFEGWSAYYGSTLTSLQFSGNDLYQTAGNTYKYLHATTTNDHEIEMKLGYPATGADSNNTRRFMYARFTDDANFIQLSTQNNGFSLVKKVGGTTTTFVAFASMTIPDNTVIKLRANGSFVRVYINGTETSQTATGNFPISDLPASSQVGISATGGAGGSTYPFPIARDLAIYAIPATALTLGSASLGQIASTPGRQNVSIPVVPQGTVTQLQTLVMSSTGIVLLDWTNTTISNGVVTTGELPATAENDTVRVWVRDTAAKAYASFTNASVPVNWRSIPAEFGLNLNGMAPYGRGIAPVDFFKSGEFRRSDYNFVVDPSISSTNSTYLEASTVGMDSDGWPTSTPSGVTLMMSMNDGGRGFSVEQSGTYDVFFTPGMNWSISVHGGWSRTAYDKAAGTATIVVNAGVASQVAALVYFNDYNGVTGAFPPAGQRMFYSVKRGENAAGFLTANSLASIKNVTSAAKPGTGYRGVTRFMTPGSINRAAISGIKYNYTRKRQPKNRLMRAGFSSEYSIEEQMAVCQATSTNMWLNIPDTMLTTEVTALAQWLKTNTPTGMKIIVEYSNEIYFNFAPGFQQTNDIYNVRAVAYANANGGSPDLIKQYARDAKAVVFNQFEAVFGYDDPRYFPVMGIQAASATLANLTSMLSEGDVWKNVKGICTGPYIGGGISGVGVGSYTETSIFTKASRDKAGVDNAGYLTDLFVAQKAMSAKVRDQSWNPFCNALAQFSLSKGKSRAYLAPMCYEFAWQHFDMKSDNTLAGTGSMTGTTLTITENRADSGKASNSGVPWRVGDSVLLGKLATVYDTTLQKNITTQITGQGTGTGGTGTYVINNSQTVVNTKFQMVISNVTIKFTGSISGTTLTVTAVETGTIGNGELTIIPFGKIAEQLSVTGPNGGIGTYRMDIAWEAGSTDLTSNTNIFGNATGTLLAQSLRDPRAGTAAVEQISWLRATGGIHCIFDHAGGAYGNLYGTSNSSWSLLDQIGNEATDYPYRSVATDMLNNG